MKIYEGKRVADTTIVTVDGAPLQPHTELRDFHADGFEWGYEGSGPCQLAFALLVEHMGAQGALENYRKFLRDVIAEIEGDEWQLTTDNVADRLRQEIVEVPMDLETLMKKVRGEI
jgi:hypothetical protein